MRRHKIRLIVIPQNYCRLKFLRMCENHQRQRRHPHQNRHHHLLLQQGNQQKIQQRHQQGKNS
jgi:hypothetical protein